MCDIKVKKRRRKCFAQGSRKEEAIPPTNPAFVEEIELKNYKKRAICNPNGFTFVRKTRTFHFFLVNTILCHCFLRASWLMFQTNKIICRPLNTIKITTKREFFNCSRKVFGQFFAKKKTKKPPMVHHFAHFSPVNQFTNDSKQLNYCKSQRRQKCAKREVSDFHQRKLRHNWTRKGQKNWTFSHINYFLFFHRLYTIAGQPMSYDPCKRWLKYHFFFEKKVFFTYFRLFLQAKNSRWPKNLDMINCKHKTNIFAW